MKIIEKLKTISKIFENISIYIRVKDKKKDNYVGQNTDAKKEKKN